MARRSRWSFGQRRLSARLGQDRYEFDEIRFSYNDAEWTEILRAVGDYHPTEDMPDLEGLRENLELDATGYLFYDRIKGKVPPKSNKEEADFYNDIACDLTKLAEKLKEAALFRIDGDEAHAAHDDFVNQMVEKAERARIYAGQIRDLKNPGNRKAESHQFFESILCFWMVELGRSVRDDLATRNFLLVCCRPVVGPSLATQDSIRNFIRNWKAQQNHYFGAVNRTGE